MVRMKRKAKRFPFVLNKRYPFRKNHFSAKRSILFFITFQWNNLFSMRKIENQIKWYNINIICIITYIHADASIQAKENTMPSTYAHFRFGQQVYHRLPEKLRSQTNLTKICLILDCTVQIYYSIIVH